MQAVQRTIKKIKKKDKWINNDLMLLRKYSVTLALLI